MRHIPRHFAYFQMQITFSRFCKHETICGDDFRSFLLVASKVITKLFDI